MGVVYQAVHLQLKRVVALKMVRGFSPTRDEQFERFRFEAEAVARLQHPNIIQIYEIGEHNGWPFFCLEFAEGGSLDKKLAGKPQPARAAAEVVALLARAMHEAHQRGIVHRDLKPPNVLLGKDGTLKITDFGLAKQLDEEAMTRTGTGAVMGTPPYMAPEQASGRTREIGPATDVYALGAMLYELLTGRPPFQAATLLDCLELVRYQEPVPPRRLQPKVPRDLETICLKCLEKPIPRRYPTAEELAEDLERFLRSEPIRARPVGRLERGIKWARRRPALAALIAVSVLAGLSLIGGALLYQDQRARAVERELRDIQRLDGVRTEVQDLIRRGQEALARKEWETARRHLSVALAQAGTEPSLEESQVQAEQLLREADRGLNEEQARTDARQKLSRFGTLRDDALFHATLATGEGLAANLKATRSAAREALGLFGVDPERGGRPSLGPLFNEGEVRLGCYELLLALADAEARPLPGEEAQTQLRRALRILDGAAQVGCSAHPLRAYHLRRARYLEQLGQGQEAEQERQRAAQRPPATALDYYLTGEESYKRGDIESAVQDFQRALRLEPGHFWAKYFLSVCYLRLARPAEARSGLTACLSQRPDFIWAYLLRGFIGTQLKEFVEAEADYRKASELLREKPSVDASHVLYANRGVLRLQQGKFAEGEADLRQAIGLKPKEYQAYVTLAQVYQKQKRLDLAIGQLDQAVQLEPDLAFLYRLRAQLEAEHEDWSRALRDLEVASRKEPGGAASLTRAKDHTQRGRILNRLGKYREAVEAFDEALKADPQYAAAHLGRAEALIKLQRFEEALAVLDRYGTSGAKPVAEAYRTRGLVRARLRRYPQALEDLTRALELKPEDSTTRTQRGWVYLASNAPQLALADFEEVLRRGAGDGDAYNGRGYARVQLGQYGPGVLDAEEALKRGPQTPSLLIDSARVFALAAGKLEADERERGRFSPDLPGEYRARVRRLIRKALGLVEDEDKRAALWRERVGPDPAFDSIRTSPEFSRMDARYSRTGPKGDRPK